MRMLIKSLTYVTCTCKFSHIFRQIPLLLLTSASPESSENNADAFLVLRKFGFISASGKKVIMTFAYEQERKVEGGGGRERGYSDCIKLLIGNRTASR